MNHNMKDHWEKIYREKRSDEFSWWQDNPRTSMAFIHSANTSPSSKIIDIGGGDSKFVDFLLDDGFENITVLDISERAIERARVRLGDKANKVHWVVSDISEFESKTIFDVWHDRATFHFLTTQTQINRYISLTRRSIKHQGHLILGTFSTNGPKTCSGLPVHQYDERLLDAELRDGFEKINCFTEDHMTPFNTKQNFLFCSFRRNFS